MNTWVKPHGTLAQLVEQLPLKQTVQGSIPWRPTQLHTKGAQKSAPFNCPHSLMDKMSGFEPEDGSSILSGGTKQK